MYLALSSSLNFCHCFVALPRSTPLLQSYQPKLPLVYCFITLSTFLSLFCCITTFYTPVTVLSTKVTSCLLLHYPLYIPVTALLHYHILHPCYSLINQSYIMSIASLPSLHSCHCFVALPHSTPLLQSYQPKLHHVYCFITLSTFLSLLCLNTRVLHSYYGLINQSYIMSIASLPSLHSCHCFVALPHSTPLSTKVTSYMLLYYPLYIPVTALLHCHILHPCYSLISQRYIMYVALLSSLHSCHCFVSIPVFYTPITVLSTKVTSCILLYHSLYIPVTALLHYHVLHPCYSLISQSYIMYIALLSSLHSCHCFVSIPVFYTPITVLSTKVTSCVLLYHSLYIPVTALLHCHILHPCYSLISQRYIMYIALLSSLHSCPSFALLPLFYTPVTALIYHSFKPFDCSFASVHSQHPCYSFDLSLI